jgi:hypothetical protein
MARRPDGPREAEREGERQAAEERVRAESARKERLRELDREHEALMEKYGRPFEELFRRRKRPNGSSP